MKNTTDQDQEAFEEDVADLEQAYDRTGANATHGEVAEAASDVSLGQVTRADQRSPGMPGGWLHAPATLRVDEGSGGGRANAPRWRAE